MSRVITARTDPETTRAYWTMGRGDAERAFRAARRHSRMVRILRIAVPASVGLRCRDRRADHLSQSAAHARQAADQHRQPRGVRHQGHHGTAAPVRFHKRRARLRTDGRHGGAGHDKAGHRRAAQHPRQGAKCRTRASMEIDGDHRHLRFQRRDAQARSQTSRSIRRPAIRAA